MRFDRLPRGNPKVGSEYSNEAAEEILTLKRTHESLNTRIASTVRALDRRKKAILSIGEWQDRIFREDGQVDESSLAVFVTQFELDAEVRARQQLQLESFISEAHIRIENMVQLVEELRAELDRHRQRTPVHPCGEIFLSRLRS